LSGKCLAALEDNMRQYFRWAIALIISVGGLGAASAADMAVKARPAPVVLPYNWTGCYVGLSGGAKGISASDTVFIPAATGLAGPTPASSLYLGRADAETWLGGGQIGCNYQSGSWVFGVEGDAHAQRWITSSTISGALPPLFVPGDIYELRSDWQASARGRIGYAVDRTLFYGTGGAAFTEVRAYTNWIPNGVFPGVITSTSRTLVGATVGAGVEHAVTDNFTLGIEGRYSWYGRQRFDAGLLPTAVGFLAPVFTTSPTYRDIRIETGEILVKANWKFGPTAVIARY
jgi:outer membrane immunogenic protein